MLSAHAPSIAFTMLVVIGAALKPSPVRRRAMTHASNPTEPNQNDHRSVAWLSVAGMALRRRTPPVDAMAAAVWCDGLARSVRSGATLSGALRSSPAVPGVDVTVASICLSLDRGSSASDAFAQATSGSPHVDLALTVLQACAEHGGPAAEPLDRAAATLRARAADRAERLTQSAQARMSALVMTCLPVAMLALMTLTSASVRSASTSSIGLVAITLGTALNVSGWLWMRRTIGREVS